MAFLREQGYEVLVVASPGPELELVREREGVAVLGVPMQREIRPAADLVSLFRLHRAVRRFRPHLGECRHAEGRAPRHASGTPGERSGGGSSPSEDCAWKRPEGLKRRILRLAERIGSRLAHRVVCVSPSLRKRYLELGLGEPSSTVVLGSGASNGVDMERFRTAREDLEGQRSLARELGLSPGEPVIGFVGRLTRDKGIVALLSSFDRVLEELPAARLLVLGALEPGDPLPAETERRLAEDPAIVWPGPVADPAPYYPLMRLLAFPSAREGLPNVPLEAAAAGFAGGPVFEPPERWTRWSTG